MTRTIANVLVVAFLIFGAMIHHTILMIGTGHLDTDHETLMVALALMPISFCVTLVVSIIFYMLVNASQTYGVDNAIDIDEEEGDG